MYFFLFYLFTKIFSVNIRRKNYGKKDYKRFLQKKIRPLSIKKRQKICSYGQPCVDTTVFELNESEKKIKAKHVVEPA